MYYMWRVKSIFPTVAARKQQEEEELRQKAETDATYVKTAPDVIGIQNNNRDSEEKIIKMVRLVRNYGRKRW